MAMQAAGWPELNAPPPELPQPHRRPPQRAQTPPGRCARAPSGNGKRSRLTSWRPALALPWATGHRAASGTRRAGAGPSPWRWRRRALLRGRPVGKERAGSADRDRTRIHQRQSTLSSRAESTTKPWAASARRPCFVSAARGGRAAERRRAPLRSETAGSSLTPCHRLTVVLV